MEEINEIVKLGRQVNETYKKVYGRRNLSKNFDLVGPVRFYFDDDSDFELIEIMDFEVMYHSIPEVSFPVNHNESYFDEILKKLIVLKEIIKRNDEKYTLNTRKEELKNKIKMAEKELGVL